MDKLDGMSRDKSRPLVSHVGTGIGRLSSATVQDIVEKKPL
jgi:hypothetical protein